MQKIKKFAVIGTTQPLLDGQTRSVTLVAVVTTTDVTDTKVNTVVKQHGKRKITTSVEDIIVLHTRTQISFGLAVLSPTDVKLQQEADAAYAQAVKDNDKVEVARLATKLNIVSPGKGLTIAYGKAEKAKSALAVITSDSQFFTTHMVKLMLDQKLKHITTDPNRFIRIAPPKTAKATVKAMTPAENKAEVVEV